MNTKHQPEHVYAISNDNNRVVHISEISESNKGLKCNCVCPLCHGVFIAKLGSHNAHHFAHQFDTNCDPSRANESALHKKAKEIFETNVGKSIMLPPYVLEGTDDPNCNKYDSRQTDVFQYSNECLFPYTEAKLEENQGTFVADVSLSSSHHKLFIEIVVTHRCDEIKVQKIKRTDISAMEIDISKFCNIEDFDEKELQQAIFEDVKNKKWLYNRKHDEAIKKLQERNKKLQAEYSSVRTPSLSHKKSKSLNQEVDKQIQRERQEIKNNCENLRCNSQLYFDITQNLINDDESNKTFKHLPKIFINEAYELYNGIPFFCNIPVHREIVFTCDRRIWQTKIFYYFIYAQEQSSSNFYKIYFFFYNDHTFLLNNKYIYLKSKKYAEYNWLTEAIEEYIFHLSKLGFINKHLEEDWLRSSKNNMKIDLPITNKTLTPPDQKTSRMLENLLKELPQHQYPLDWLKDEMHKRYNHFYSL